MRIGLIIYGDLEQASGGYLYDRMLVAHLRKRGQRVQILSLPWRTYAGLLRDNFSAGLFNKLKSLKVDVLLQDELNHPSLFLINEKLRREVSYPIVSIVHMVRANPAVHGPSKLLPRWVETRYLKSVDAFVFNSQETKRLVSSMAPDKKPWVVATPGGDRIRPKTTDAEIRARAQQPGPLCVIFLGNLTRNKAAHTLIEAAARLNLASVHVTLAGRDDVEPNYVDFLRRRVARLGLDGWVTFAGHLEGKRLEATLRTNQILVVPSAYEGFGIAYLEGLGFGLPAIGTQAGGAKEIIQHGKNGYLIPVGDTDRLARTLEKLNEDRQLLTRLSLAARRSFSSFPGWDQSMQRVHRFLTAL